MPPSTPSVMFQRGGNYFQHRLTKLYSDTKQSYASNVTPASTSAGEDPEVLEVRRDFQIQHDRLLAWGYHWTDTKAAEAQHHGHGDVEIDKKLDQAGFGDLVAGIMSEIQTLLDESGRLQHPERYLANKGSKLPPSSQLTKKEWTRHEVTTARALLDQLITRIDTLYGLSESRRTLSQSEKFDTKYTTEDTQSPPNSRKSMEDPEATTPSRKRQRTVDEKPLPQEPIYEDPFFLDFRQLEFQEDSAQDSLDPPPYEELSSAGPEQLLATLKPNNTKVIVDLVVHKQVGHAAGASLNLDQLHNLASLSSRLAGLSELSHNGHFKFLGFTVDKAQHRLGFVYAMPTRAGTIQRPRQRTLAAIIRTGHSSTDPSSPNLENRFRLAYNLVLTLLGYVTADTCHAQLNSGNIVYDVGSGRTNTFRDWEGIRTPLLLPSALSAITTPVAESHNAQIFRHPADDPKYDTEAVPSHNIYSLGLILLEIGLWMPLTKLWKTKYNRTTFMARIKSVYVRNLASKCSTKYMRAVEKCLDAPYQDVSTFTTSRNGLQGPGAYLLDIARDLAQCCAIDDDGPPPASDLEYFSAMLAKKAQNEAHQESAADLYAPLTPSSMPDDDDDAIEQLSEAGSEIVKSEVQGESFVLRKWPEIDIPQEDLDQWNTVLMPRLSRLLQNALDRSSESCSVSLMMVGLTSETARTTICIQCRNTTAVHNALRRRFRPKRGWGVVILKGEVRRSGRRKEPNRRQKQPEAPMPPACEKLREQFYQKKPVCGASIGAFKDGEHLPPVSFGGTILVDGQPFGMTVHHMLDDVSDDEDGAETRRSAASRELSEQQLQTLHDDLVFMQPDDEIPSGLGDLQLSDDEGGDNDSDSDTSTIRPDYSAFDAEGNEFWFLEDAPESDPGLDDDKGSGSESSNSDDEDDDTASIGDRVGVDPADDDTFHITQPAIDDVDEDFFPNADDRDDDHLASHSFGYLHASSGIRRVVSGDIKHEVDWALIKIQEERLHVGNAIRKEVSARRRRGTRPSRTTTTATHSSDPMLTGVMASQKLAGTEVHCCGRSSGFKKGRISQAMSLVKLHGRQSFSSSWCVEGGFGIPGDSGAWVYNPANRQLCGHVLAWGDKSKTAYIAPMEVLFEDIKETLGAESVCLPGTQGEDGGAEMGAGRKRDQEETSRQLRDAREIEVALRGMGLTEAPTRRMESPVGKDVASVRQREMAGQSQGVVQIVS